MPCRRPFAALSALLLPVLLVMGGCSDAAYYWQAGMGQLEIINARRPISEVLQDPEAAQDLKVKLRLVLDAQVFGTANLGFSDDRHFRYYSDVGRKYVSWLVVASDAYAVKEFRHCFLIVGCLGYRGFFAKADADAFSAELAEAGYDVLVRPVRAYSTLGWFDDPVLSTYIRSPDFRLVATIFHEQAHGLLFVNGDTAFSESFATFVEEEGVRRYLVGRGGPDSAQLERYLTLNADQRRFREIVLGGRGRLENLYASQLPRAEMTGEKQRLFALLKADYQKAKKSFKIASYDAWFDRELNNAHLVGFEHYRSWLRAFQAMFDRNGRDFTRFYAAARELAEQPREVRDARLKSLEEETEGGRIADS